ncbi:hypothetical protein VTO42DRAFT_6616 [Malbranchea cinnamomea]
MLRNARKLASSSVWLLKCSRAFSSAHLHHAQRSTASSGSASTSRPQLSDFKRPVAKCFLGALLTYQLVYLAWLKLEADDVKAAKKAELASLEAEVRKLVARKDSMSS